MLDTNVVSMFMHGRSRALDQRIAGHGRSELCISAVTLGEMQYGLRNRPDALRLAYAARLFLEMVEVLPWSAQTAFTYGQMRADLRRAGLAMQSLDMMIAAHALSIEATLVTRDTAFRHIPGLSVADWSQD